jgi:hypothetical protein
MLGCFMECSITKVHFNFVSYWQPETVNINPAACLECWQCCHSSWLLIIALTVVWQPELVERNEYSKDIYKSDQITSSISFFLLYRYDICTYKNKPCGTLGKFLFVCLFVYKRRIVQIVFLEQWFTLYY